MCRSIIGATWSLAKGAGSLGIGVASLGVGLAKQAVGAAIRDPAAAGRFMAGAVGVGLALSALHNICTPWGSCSQICTKTFPPSIEQTVRCVEKCVLNTFYSWTCSFDPTDCLEMCKSACNLATQCTVSCSRDLERTALKLAWQAAGAFTLGVIAWRARQ
jgi:hypothetical protein